MHKKDSQQRAFLEKLAIEPSWLEALAVDASPRRYFRVSGSHPPVLLMNTNPDELRRFVTVAHLLADLGLSAPHVYDVEVETGLALLEDFGDDTFARLLDNGGDQRALYVRALDTLVALHAAHNACRIPLPPYDANTLLMEAALFVDWYLPEVTGQQLRPTFRDRFCSLWARVLANTVLRRNVVVLRDYHMDNLMLLPQREGVAACGLLDFQDAVLGAPAYDVMSMLQDVRRDVPEPLKHYLLQRYLNAFPAMDRHTFFESYVLLAAQRHMKVAGIFIRLFRRDGKPGYLKYLPRVVRLLEHALEHPLLAPLRSFLAQEIPRWPAMASAKTLTRLPRSRPPRAIR